VQQTQQTSTKLTFVTISGHQLIGTTVDFEALPPCPHAEMERKAAARKRERVVLVAAMIFTALWDLFVVAMVYHQPEHDGATAAGGEGNEGQLVQMCIDVQGQNTTLGALARLLRG